MSIIDMPLDELKQYKGMSPCPSDFDEFWDKGIREVGMIAPNVEMRPAAFQLKGFECYDLFYTSIQNARIHAKVIKPVTSDNLPIAGKLPIALHFHGYSGRAYDWNEHLAYAAAGFCVAAMDCRGQAGESEDIGNVKGNTLHGQIIRGLPQGKEHLLFRQIFLDTVQLANVMKAMTFTDETRICAFGGSQGGALTMACAALVPEVSQLAPMYPFLCDYKRVLKLNIDTGAYIELKEYLRMFDPTYKHFDETMHTLGYIDIVNFAKRIKGETLLAVTLNDDVCPPSTVYAAYNNIVAKKDIRIYPHHGHEPLPYFWDEVIQKFQKELC
ncbi:MAG: acetylxylan esterase [Treponema sp.]|jgi:cephalosporin-C deacetylase|nr:acetylxylan esterase [Treponema sp.]